MSSFYHSLSDHDRDVLRRVVKMVHLKHHPKEFCTDREADKVIASIGPEVVEKFIRVGKNTHIDKI